MYTRSHFSSQDSLDLIILVIIQRWLWQGIFSGSRSLGFFFQKSQNPEIPGIGMANCQDPEKIPKNPERISKHILHWQIPLLVIIRKLQIIFVETYLVRAFNIIPLWYNSYQILKKVRSYFFIFPLNFF